MDLKPDVFKGRDPQAIARSLKSSAEHSDRRKADPYRSAMSMLTFYINRVGHNLEPAHHAVLEKAKDALRSLFGKAPAPARSAKRSAAKNAPARKRATSGTPRARARTG